MRQSVLWLLSLLSILVVVVVTAQLVTAQAFAQVSATPSAQLANNATQLAALRDQYRTQLDIYRVNERNFAIARDQYTQLQTLTSLEDAVKATQKVLLTRDEVLITYMKMLRLTFGETTGIQLQLKNDQLKSIDAVIVALEKNKDLASRAVSRDQISLTVADFTLLKPTLQQVSSRTLLITSYGKVQALFDKTVAARNEIKTHILEEQTDALKLSEKQRAFDQIDQTVKGVDQSLKSTLAVFAPTTSSQQSTESDELLNQAYAGISRTLSYLQEVLTN
jgi:hypothetical protein